MAQIFHRSTNTISRVSIYGAVILIALLGFAVNVVNQTSYVTEVHNARPQPVPFSHKHHVGELGLDCRYCHSSVEVSSSAGKRRRLHDLPRAHRGDEHYLARRESLYALVSRVSQRTGELFAASR